MNHSDSVRLHGSITFSVAVVDSECVPPCECQPTTVWESFFDPPLKNDVVKVCQVLLHICFISPSFSYLVSRPQGSEREKRSLSKRAH